ncbi:MAG: DNA-formamidopyrimidine glycosylase, partial [Mollicutes bacterium]|nr:DNA-formamidopyrimidine glycosylase [Mollicutes bacterium]
MPELPEVRTVAKVLKKLINKKIKNIDIIYPKIISKDSLNLDLLINKSLKDINTLGKYLLFDYEQYI